MVRSPLRVREFQRLLIESVTGVFKGCTSGRTQNEPSASDSQARRLRWRGFPEWDGKAVEWVQFINASSSSSSSGSERYPGGLEWHKKHTPGCCRLQIVRPACSSLARRAVEWHRLCYQRPVLPGTVCRWFQTSGAVATVGLSLLGF